MAGTFLEVKDTSTSLGLGPCLELPVLWSPVLGEPLISSSLPLHKQLALVSVCLPCSYFEAVSFHHWFPIASLHPFLLSLMLAAVLTVRGRDSPNTVSGHRYSLTASMSPLQLSAPTCQSCLVVAWQSDG